MLGLLGLFGLPATHRPVVSVLVFAATLAERDTLVSAEDEVVVADAAFHARLSAGAAGAGRVLAAGLGAR